MSDDGPKLRLVGSEPDPPDPKRPKKRMTPKEFRELGFLRELNRTWLHPLGLALETVAEDDGTETFGAVWDYRDEPEGIAFTDDVVESEAAREQADAIEALRQSKAEAREELFGWVIQPVGKESP